MSCASLSSQSIHVQISGDVELYYIVCIKLLCIFQGPSHYEIMKKDFIFIHLWLSTSLLISTTVIWEKMGLWDIATCSSDSQLMWERCALSLVWAVARIRCEGVGFNILKMWLLRWSACSRKGDWVELMGEKRSVRRSVWGWKKNSKRHCGANILG